MLMGVVEEGVDVSRVLEDVEGSREVDGVREAPVGVEADEVDADMVCVELVAGEMPLTSASRFTVR